MNRIIITALALVVSTGAAFAQAPKAPKAANAPTPAATAPAAKQAPAPATGAATSSPAPIARPSSMGVPGLTGMALFEANVATRQTACSQKGQLFKWIPPHKPGDVGGNGKVYSSFSNGRCDIDKTAVRAASGR